MGSLEVLVGSGETRRSYGTPVKAMTDDAVAIVVETVHGITGLVPVAEPAARGEAVPVAEWEALTDDGQTVRVVLWRDLDEPEPEEPPIDEEPADAGTDTA